MNTEGLSVYKSSFALTKQLMSYSDNIVRKYRFGLYEQTISMSLEVTDSIYAANIDFKSRYDALTKCLTLLGGIRSRVRIMGEMGILSPRMAAILMRMIEDISKQTGGWRKKSDNRQSRGGMF